MSSPLSLVEIRWPVTPFVYFNRLRKVAFSLLSLQIFHLLVFTKPTFGAYLIWLIYAAFTVYLLSRLRSAVKRCHSHNSIDWHLLTYFILIVAFFKVYSRIPYVSMFFAEGLKAARESEDVVTGGFSFVNIFFYPAAILYSQAVIKKSIFKFSASVVFLVCAIDMIFLGTRNAPAFVLLFYFISSSRIGFERSKVKLVLLLVFSIALFNYSTTQRTQEYAEGNFDWIAIFEYTGSAEILKFDLNIIKYINDSAPVLMPLIFLSHYFTHSLAEFNYIAGFASIFGADGAPYTTYQFCPVMACDKEMLLQYMEDANPRAGKYTTAFGMMLIDYGIVGVVVTFCAILAGVLIASWRLGQKCPFYLPLVGVLVLLMSVENYLYNGLGLIQTLMIFPLNYAFWFFKWWRSISKAPESTIH